MKTLITLTLLCFFSIASYAQGEFGDKRHTLSLQAGYGWFGLLNNEQGEINFEENGSSTTDNFTANFNGTPAATLAYDYRIGRIFSLGGAVGVQSLRIDEVRDLNANENVEGDVRIARTFLSVRTLFHYGSNPKWDLYSGVRTGVTFWNVRSTLEENQFSFTDGVSIDRGSFVLPHLAPIPFGFKFYPDDRFMVGAELSVGSPHILALQAGIRL